MKDKAKTSDTDDICNLVLGNGYYTTILSVDSITVTTTCSAHHQRWFLREHGPLVRGL